MNLPWIVILQSPIMYVYDYIMNLDLSRCTRLHVCCTGSVVLQENQVIVQTGTYVVFLAVTKNVPTMIQSIGLFTSWFSCREMLALSVLLLFFHYPTCKDDYRTSQTTVHCKTDFVNRPCLRRTRTAWQAAQFVLRGWGHFSIAQSGSLNRKILFTNISASDLRNYFVAKILQHKYIIINM